MKTINQYRKSSEVVKIFDRLFSVKNSIHLFHLKSNSYSEHKVLEGFYESLTELSDELIESYQGKYGRVSDIKIEKETNAISVIIRKLAEEIESLSIEDRFLQNILDEIVLTCYRTLYLLSMN